MATVLEYSGVTIRNVVTREFNEELVYDPSETDPIGHRFKIQVEGLIHIQGDVSQGHHVGSGSSTGQSDGSYSVTGHGSPESVHIMLREALMLPRMTLELFVVDQSDTKIELLRCVGLDSPRVGDAWKEDAHRDIAYGPKPRDFRILAIVGSSMIRVAYTIECTKFECLPTPYAARSQVLSNRWSVAEEMDENYFTTRTLRGRLIMSGTELSPHLVKLLCLPGLELGFKRTHVSLVASEDGLTAEYTVVDKQVHNAAPWPATKMDCKHTESTADGVSFFAACQVTLWGPPHVDKRFLISRCLQIVDSRLNLIARTLGTQYRLLSADITDHLGEENSVSVNYRIQHIPTDNVNEYISGINIKRLGVPLRLPSLKQPSWSPGEVEIPGTEYDRRQSSSPPAYGFDSHGDVRLPTVVGLLSVLTHQPCFPGGPPGPARFEDTPETRAKKQKGKRTEMPTAVEVFVSPGEELAKRDFNLTLTAYSREHQAAMYTMAKMESRYETDEMVCQLPIARKVGPRSNKATSTIVSLGGGQARRVILYEAERVGGANGVEGGAGDAAPWPRTPSPVKFYDHGKGLTARLIEHDIQLQAPRFDTDGVHRIYRLSARLVYALSRPPNPDEELSAGLMPFSDLGPVNQKSSKFNPKSYTPELLG